MFKRYGFIVFAFGLAGGALAQQSPEETVEQGREGSGQDQGESRTTLPGLPVRILEDPEEAERSQREQQEAEDREIEDLEAQNLAAKSAQKAVWVSAAQTLLAFFGTIALIYSLHLNRKATNAAVEAVRVSSALGEAELRAYISFGGVRMISHREDKDPQTVFWRLHFGVKNTGATPARKAAVRSHFCIVSNGEEVLQIPPETKENFVPIGIGETVGVGSFDILGVDFGAIKRGEKRFYFLCEVVYGNAINPDSRHVFRMGTFSGSVTGDPEKFWDPDNPLEVALPHMLQFNENS